jgi:hypothetical protein
MHPDDRESHLAALPFLLNLLQISLPLLLKPGKTKPSAKPKIGLEDRVLVALKYWREYRTYFHIGSSWGISESTVCRIVHWVEDQLMASGCFRLPGKKQLVQGFGCLSVVVIDGTETPIERPKRRQRQFYSGKKKRHTLNHNLRRRYGLCCNLIAALYNYELSLESQLG